MGLIDFVRSAGEKLWGDEDERKERARKEQPRAGRPAGAGAARTSAPAGGAKPTPTFDELRTRLLRQAIEKNGLEVQGLDLQVQGERAIVSGKVASQEVREKVVLVVGNTAGIAQVDDRLVVERKGTAVTGGPAAPGGAAARGESEARFYTVKPGDTLSKIAKEFYGAASKYPQIFEANRPMLKDPDKIYPGQVLRIPPG